jgi:hypothetical protein
MENIDELWAAYERAREDRASAESRLLAAREAIVSRICTCYVREEPWEERALNCFRRLSHECPYYLELTKRGLDH